MAKAVITKTRDLRIDLARGICLCFILVDHTSGNVLNRVTLGNFAVCDAMDVFVFLCGVSAALAYGGKLDRAGWWEASKAVLRRLWIIYLAELALIMTFVAIATASRALGPFEIERIFWMEGRTFDAVGLVRLVSLVDHPGFLNTLPLYMALLSWFALIMPLIKRPLCLLVLSTGLWLATHLHLITLGAPYNVAGWQFTFTLGALCCRYVHLLRRPELRQLDIAAISLLVAGICANLVVADTWEAYDQLGLPLRVLLRGVDKGNLDPGRVLSVLALAWLVFRYVPRNAPWLQARRVATLVLLGQHSLPVFTVGVVLSGLSEAALLQWHESFGAEVVVNATSITGLVAVAHLSRFRSGTSRGWLSPVAAVPMSG